MDDHAAPGGSNAAHAVNPDGEEEEGVTADSYGSIDVSAISNSCWMIKVPQKLCELWEAADEGTQVGELIFTKGGTTQNGKKKIPPSLEVSVSEILAREQHEKKINKNKQTTKKPPPGPVATSPVSSSPHQNTKLPSSLPLHYRLEALTNKVPTLHPFTRNPQNGSCTITGTISRTANLQVQRDDAYRQLLRNRLLHHTIQTKTFVKPADTTDSIVKRGGAKNTATTTTTNSNKRSFGNAVLQFGKRQLEASQEHQAHARHGSQYNTSSNKQARHFAPDQSLRSVLFELFAQEPFWTVKDLKAAAVAGGCSAAIPKKAEAELRDMLKNELAVYHRSGDHKTKWELRPEFQQSVVQQGMSGSAANHSPTKKGGT